MTESSPRCAVVADDDEFFRVAMNAILVKRLDFAEVIETGSLDEALARLGERNGRVTLALFDLEMPGMAGAASLSAVRECFPDIRVAIVSASIRRRDILLALAAGAHGYVPKGLGVTDLTRAIELILSGIIFVPPSLADPPSSRYEAIGPSEELSFGQAAKSEGVPPLDIDVGQDSTLDLLTRRQREVLDLIVAGKSNKEISRVLDLREGTVKVHVSALFRTLGVSNRSSAAVSGAHLLKKFL